MGRGHVIEHCISALRFYRQEEIYKEYMSEMLRHICAGIGYKTDVKYLDLMERVLYTDDSHEREVDAEEIIGDIKGKVAKLQGSG